ncbi:MAG: low molecular weight phosphotyrosine protein phosphatase [Ruminococcaceae bacterium]|nr:low molecular weight phosphotyrosine protein phosphatase [Oscillospiraceae bacterium]
MYRIMFVCHGNICRSPMAEFILKDMIKDSYDKELFVIASSATSTEEIYGGRGNPVYPPAKRELAAHGISCEGKSAIQLKLSDYNKYDIFAVMDSANLRNAKRILNGDPENKVVKLLSFTENERDVEDPWYSGDFSGVYKDITEGCKALLKKVRDN